MKGYIVGFSENIALRCLFDVAGEPPCRLDGKVRVTSDDLHSEADGGVCDKSADSAESDNAESLAEELRTREFGAFFLYKSHGGGIAGKALLPFDTVGDTAGGEEERAKSQLLHSVCIRPGGVEDAYTRLCTALDGDIVDQGSGAGDAEKLGIELHIGHDSRAHHNGVGALDGFTDHVVLFTETDIFDA